MRPSTLAELAGFGLVTYAAYRWAPTVGILVGGVCLLLIGYATEDRASALAVSRMFSPLRKVRAKHKLRRSNRKRIRQSRQERRGLFGRQPQELILRVKAD